MSTSHRHLRADPDSLTLTEASATWRNERGQSFVAERCPLAGEPGFVPGTEPGDWEIYRVAIVDRCDGVIEYETDMAIGGADVIGVDELQAIIGRDPEAAATVTPSCAAELDAELSDDPLRDAAEAAVAHAAGAEREAAPNYDTPRIWEAHHRDASTGTVTLMGSAHVVPFLSGPTGDHTEIAFYDANGDREVGYSVECFTPEGAARWLNANGFHPRGEGPWTPPPGQPDPVATVQTWATALPHAETDAYAADVVAYTEEQLRATHPTAMAHYDSHRAAGADPAGAMYAAAPVFDEPQAAPHEIAVARASMYRDSLAEGASPASAAEHANGPDAHVLATIDASHGHLGGYPHFVATEVATATPTVSELRAVEAALRATPGLAAAANQPPQPRTSKPAPAPAPVAGKKLTPRWQR